MDLVARLEVFPTIEPLHPLFKWLISIKFVSLRWYVKSEIASFPYRTLLRQDAAQSLQEAWHFADV